MSVAALARSRAARDLDGLFLAEGVRFLARALATRADVRHVIWCRTLTRGPTGRRLVEEAASRGVPTERVDAAAFCALSTRVEPDGVLVVAAQPWRPLPATARRSYLLLDHVRAPGNLGSLIRTAQATGVAGVIAVGGELDPFTPGAVRASMGACFDVAFHRADTGALDDWLARHAITVIGASADAMRDLRDEPFEGRTAIALGSERRGLSPALRERCDRLVSIPMAPGIDSLNVAVAGALVLFERYRRRAPRRRDRPLARIPR